MTGYKLGSLRVGFLLGKNSDPSRLGLWIGCVLMPSVELPEFQSLIVEGSQSCCTIKKNCQTTLSQTHKHILHIEPGTAATWIFVRGYIVSTPEAVFPILCPDNWNGCTFVFWILDYTKMEIQYSYTKLPVNIDSRWLNITHIYIYRYIS